MTLKEFRDSLLNDEPPGQVALAGLWWDAKGDWTRAHESAQQDEGPAGAWVHAYLHRKEGDASNAEYWYNRAGRKNSSASFEIEWDEIAKALLHRPKVLLMDEASTGLDPAARRDLSRHVENLRDHEGVTILLTTHILEEADRCDRLILLHQGKIVAQGSPGELRARIGGERSGLPRLGLTFGHH